jgi:hypothetical protein
MRFRTKHNSRTLLSYNCDCVSRSARPTVTVERSCPRRIAVAGTSDCENVKLKLSNVQKQRPYKVIHALVD